MFFKRENPGYFSVQQKPIRRWTFVVFILLFCATVLGKAHISKSNVDAGLMHPTFRSRKKPDSTCNGGIGAYHLLESTGDWVDICWVRCFCCLMKLNIQSVCERLPQWLVL